MLRRPRTASGNEPGRRQLGPLELDPAAREVRVEGEPVELTKLEFDLLDVLTGEPRLVFSRGQLIERVWGPGWFGDDRLVDVHIANLRRKLGGPDAYKCSIRGRLLRQHAGSAQADSPTSLLERGQLVQCAIAAVSAGFHDHVDGL
jgi:DNA-binding response OmpR family regulator